jgi:hypothetical protein
MFRNALGSPGAVCAIAVVPPPSKRATITASIPVVFIFDTPRVVLISRALVRRGDMVTRRNTARAGRQLMCSLKASLGVAGFRGFGRLEEKGSKDEQGAGQVPAPFVSV